MANEPNDANEAFQRLAPRLAEISETIGRLPLRERANLANMLLGYFIGLAAQHRRPDVRVVQETQRDLAS